MKFIGLVGTTDFGNAQTIDGRFLIQGGVCYDLLLNQITNIVPPKLPAQYQIPFYYGNMNSAFINLALQETIMPLWKNGSANFNKMGRFDFAGNLKSFFLLDRSSGWNNNMYAFGFWNNRYHILSRDYWDGNVNYYVFKIAEGGEAVTVQRFIEAYDRYGTWNFPNGLVFVRSNAAFQAEYKVVGSIPEFSPVFDRNGYPAAAAVIRANVAGIYHGAVVRVLYNSYTNVTVPTNGLVTASANGGLPWVIIAGQRFDLQFDPIYAGLIIRGTLTYGPVPYAVLDGNRLFSAVYYPRFSHNFSDNFARGVPIAGSHRS